MELEDGAAIVTGGASGIGEATVRALAGRGARCVIVDRNVDVMSKDVGRALSIADRLEVGMVGINRGLVSDPAAPFGGVKGSGIGREGGREGIDAYLETKYVAIDA